MWSHYEKVSRRCGLMDEPRDTRVGGGDRERDNLYSRNSQCRQESRPDGRPASSNYSICIRCCKRVDLCRRVVGSSGRRKRET